MKTLWDEGARADLLRRIRALTPDHTPRWGRMRADEMLAHVAAGMRIGLGEIATKPRKTVFRY